MGVAPLLEKMVPLMVSVVAAKLASGDYIAAAGPAAADWAAAIDAMMADEEAKSPGAFVA